MSRRTRELEQFVVRTEAGILHTIHRLVEEELRGVPASWVVTREIYRFGNVEWAHATNEGRILIEKTGELCCRV